MADAGWSTLQTPVAAGLAWYIAHTLLGHPQPFFAPTAAAVSLSKNRVLRGQRSLQLIAGVMLGIGIGTAVKAVAGSTSGDSGAVEIGVAVAMAFVAALVLGSGFFEQGVLFVNQSATSAILMIAVVGTAAGSERLADALIGGGVTLVIAVILFPAAPLPLIQEATQQVFGALRDTLARLAAVADAGQTTGPEWAIAAGQRVQSQLAGLQEARSTARQVANFAPRRWAERSQVRRAGQQTAPLQLIAASVLSLAHASTTVPDGQQPHSPALCEALSELRSAFAALAEGGDGSAARAAQHASRALATGVEHQSGPRSQLVARLVETCAEDTLLLTSEAGSRVP